MAKLKTLEDLYIHELKDMYSAETQLIDALPKVMEKVNSDELKNALDSHLCETKKQRDMVKGIIESHGKDPEGETCDAMKGLVKETEGTMKEDMEEMVMDAAIIGCCQRVEHYEMAGYGTARAFAQALGFSEDVKIISEIYEQEENADSYLTKIAVNTVNPSK